MGHGLCGGTESFLLWQAEVENLHSELVAHFSALLGLAGASGELIALYCL